MLRIEGRIVHPDRELEGSIEIDPRTGLIASMGPLTGSSDLDCSNCLIFPGFGDIHIHAREDASGKQTYKEDFTTASAAAPVDDASYASKERLTEKSLVHVTLYAGIGPQTAPLARNVPYKAFMGPSVGDLFFASQAQLEQAIAKYHGKNVSFHCEDPVILEASKSAPTHEQRRPASAEITATEFALYLIEKYELIGKLCHYSTGDGLAKVRRREVYA